MKREPTFWVKAKWDQENQIFWSESNIIGLHIEAARLDEFQEFMIALVPDLIAANHGEEELICHETERAWEYEKKAAYGEQLLQGNGQVD
ncbi:MAG: DUF1902 domain-containing protein [Spirochaetaceae bacterium]|nr:DUF1902 domain-containing protein [Spirochaetaceae bacterium]